jgi:hypothetical protein
MSGEYVISTKRAGIEYELIHTSTGEPLLLREGELAQFEEEMRLSVEARDGWTQHWNWQQVGTSNRLDYENMISGLSLKPASDLEMTR